MKKFQKGFTLIELLIVIAIIGILGAALLIGINPIQQIRKARDAGLISRAKQVIDAAERTRTLSATASIVCADMVTSGELKNAAVCTGVTGPTCDAAGVCTATVTVTSMYYIGCCTATCVVPTGLTTCM